MASDQDTPNDPLATLLASPGGFALAVDAKFQLPLHLQVLNKHLVDLATGRIKRLIVQMPPRHGKSELCSKFMPAWFLGLWPDKHVILASYEERFAASWSRKARDLLVEHGHLFGVHLRRDSKAAAQWGIEYRRGGMMAAGAGGPMTGKGADLIIIDDPIKNQEEALSLTMREKVWDWYRSTVRTRLEPDGSMMLIMTRWHHDDLAGRLIAASQGGEDQEEAEPWTVISLPATALPGDPIGRAPGQALWPERYNEQALDVIRRTVGPSWWNALYQQQPVPEEGGMFKREWFRYYKRVGGMLFHKAPEGETAPPPVEVATLLKFGVADLAVTSKESGDYTAVGVFGQARSGAVYLLDMVRVRLEGPDLLPMLRKVCAKWNLSLLWIEKVAFQLAIIQLARREGLPVRELKPDRDKEARAWTATPMMEAGQFWLPEKADWLHDYETELLQFPAGAHDDMVDVTAYGLGYCIPRKSMSGAPNILGRSFRFPKGWQVNEPVF